MTTNQADKLKNIVNIDSNNESNTKFIAITSGKGGVGKSTISANMANILASNGYKVGLFDADIGLANLDVILNVRINKTLLDVLKGKCSLEEIIVDVRENLFLIPGESGEEILKFSDPFLFERFMNEAKCLNDLDFLIIDTGAGIGGATQLFLEAADEVVIVTVPDPAAITDAYATIKITSKVKDNLLILINMARSKKEANMIFEKLRKVALNNIGEKLELVYLGNILQDKNISNSIKQRTLFSENLPNSMSTNDLKIITSNILNRLERKVLKNNNPRSFGSFFKRLIEQF